MGQKTSPGRSKPVFTGTSSISWEIGETLLLVPPGRVVVGERVPLERGVMRRRKKLSGDRTVRLAHLETWASELGETCIVKDDVPRFHSQLTKASGNVPPYLDHSEYGLDTVGRHRADSGR